MYDKDRADRAVNFIRRLKHTKGQWHGKTFDLRPWQEKIVRDIFGTIKPDGFRQYRTVYIEVPRKNGKSELAAAIALLLLFADNEEGAEIIGEKAPEQEGINQNIQLIGSPSIIPSKKMGIFHP
jgi:phage terminase large subunit-like protein